ncbi:MAG: hypothetical protein ACO4A4_04375, partial [Ilumatobacteraceae bacterium]
VMLVRNEPWVDLMALGLTLVISHLGLLFWEMRYVSATLAFPGLKPTLTSTMSGYDSVSSSIPHDDNPVISTEKANV